MLVSGDTKAVEGKNGISSNEYDEVASLQSGEAYIYRDI